VDKEAQKRTSQVSGPLYTFEIVTPKGGLYIYDHSLFNASTGLAVAARPLCNETEMVDSITNGRIYV